MAPPKKPRTKAATKNTVPSAADFVGESTEPVLDAETMWNHDVLARDAATTAAETKRPVGRPTKYQAGFAREASKLCALGATDAQLADFFEVSVSTINLWKVQHAEFSESVKVPKLAANERVEQSLYRRAMGYEHDEVDIRVVEGQIIQTPIRKYYPPDSTAMIFWLKNRDPEQWREKVEHELTGKNGGAIESLVTIAPDEAYKAMIADRSVK